MSDAEIAEIINNPDTTELNRIINEDTTTGIAVLRKLQTALRNKIKTLNDGYQKNQLKNFIDLLNEKITAVEILAIGMRLKDPVKIRRELDVMDYDDEAEAANTLAHMKGGRRKKIRTKRKRSIKKRVRKRTYSKRR